MSGPRDCTGMEGKMFKLAVKIRDAEMLRELVNDRYPNVLWGSVTEELSTADQEWTREVLRCPVPVEDDFNTY